MNELLAPLNLLPTWMQGIFVGIAASAVFLRLCTITGMLHDVERKAIQAAKEAQQPAAPEIHGESFGDVYIPTDAELELLDDSAVSQTASQT